MKGWLIKMTAKSEKMKRIREELARKLKGQFTPWKWRGRVTAVMLAACVAFTATASAACAATSAYTVSDSTIVKFTESSISAAGAYDGYEIDGTTITITESGTYVFSGTCSDGNIVVKKGLTGVNIIFNGLNLTSSTTAPFNAKSDTEVTITLAAGTSNSLTDTDRDEEKPKACLNSSGDLTITGSGSLTVTGSNKQGIKADGTLIVESGNITVSAVKKALKADEKVIIGTENGDDADLSVTVTDSFEGIESENVYIYSGTIDITASDDGINTASSDDEEDTTDTTDSTSDSTSAQNTPGGGDMPAVGDYNIYIYGGDITVDAGGDGLDSNGSIYMYDGVAEVFQTGNGDGAIDYETSCEITGGTILAAGTSGMAGTPTSTDKSQAYLNFTSSSQIPSGSTISIKDASGNTVYTTTLKQAAQSIVFSSPELTAGTTYTLYSGSTQMASASATTENGNNGMGGGMNGGMNNGMGGGPGGAGAGQNGQPPQMPGSGNNAGEPQGTQTSFTDVDSSAWYAGAVNFVTGTRLMSGTSSTAFNPNSAMTRAMLVTVLWRAENQPSAASSASFTDVASGSWYSDAVSWAVENGIVNGTSDTTFSPDRSITRQEIATILQRYAEYKGVDVTQTDDLAFYTDSGSVASWAQAAVGWAVKSGIVTGATETTIAPASAATRAQVATMIMRYMQANNTSQGTAPGAMMNQGGDRNGQLEQSV